MRKLQTLNKSFVTIISSPCNLHNWNLIILSDTYKGPGWLNELGSWIT
jgi:hypothetical protein